MDDKKTVYTFGDDDLYTGAYELDATYRVPLSKTGWTIPYNAVEFAPPLTGPREIAKINAERTAWTVIPYWVGHVYWLADRSKHKIEKAGVEPPAGALSEDPGPSLDDIKADRIRAITSDCEAAIVAGFASDALGAEFFYPCKLTDQANLMASVNASREAVDPDWRAPFWCMDAAGEWSYQLHSGEQIRKVGMDGYATTLAKLQRKAVREAAIMAADSPEAVAAVVWEEAA